MRFPAALQAVLSATRSPAVFLQRGDALDCGAIDTLQRHAIVFQRAIFAINGINIAFFSHVIQVIPTQHQFARHGNRTLPLTTIQRIAVAGDNQTANGFRAHQRTLRPFRLPVTDKPLWRGHFHHVFIVIDLHAACQRHQRGNHC